jgi:hypothetical protein
VQLASYFAGHHAILGILDEYRRAKGAAFSWKDFNERLVSAGFTVLCPAGAHARLTPVAVMPQAPRCSGRMDAWCSAHKGTVAVPPEPDACQSSATLLREF